MNRYFYKIKDVKAFLIRVKIDEFIKIFVLRHSFY